MDPIALYDPNKEVEHYLDGQHNGGYFNPKNTSVYGYTYQNPVRYVDPNGKQSDKTSAVDTYNNMPWYKKAIVNFLLTLDGVSREWSKHSSLSRTLSGKEVSDEFLGNVGYMSDDFMLITSIYGLAKPKVGGKVPVSQGKSAPKVNFGKFVTNVLKSASRIVKGRTSRGIQALSKKINRGDKAYKGLKATKQNVNKIIKDVLNSKNKVYKETRNQQGKEVFDIFNKDTGQGIRLEKNTGKFDTFLNYKDKF